MRDPAAVSHTCLLLSPPVWSGVTVEQLYGYMGDRANALNSTFQSALGPDVVQNNYLGSFNHPQLQTSSEKYV